MRTFFKIVGVILLVAALLALLVGFRSFAFQPFSVPSTSMEPTLVLGDNFFVSKYSYGYSHYSLPFSPPLFPGRILTADPQLGDVVVFRTPKDDRVDYVKRVAGLPGDRVQMIDGMLNINGRPVKQERIEDFLQADDFGNTTPVKRWRETLPNGVSYETLQLMDNSFYSHTNVYEVPPGHFFALGDNRDNSLDSSAPEIGYVPLDNLVGRAEIIFLSKHPERIGMRVR